MRNLPSSSWSCSIKTRYFIYPSFFASLPRCECQEWLHRSNTFCHLSDVPRSLLSHPICSRHPFIRQRDSARMEAMQHLSRSGPEVLHLELEPKNANPHASSYPGHCYMIDGFLFDKPVPPMSPLSHPHSKNFRPFYETQICKAPYLSRRVCWFKSIRSLHNAEEFRVIRQV